jgi:hypothetical protein
MFPTLAQSRGNPGGLGTKLTTIASNAVKAISDIVVRHASRFPASSHLYYILNT